MEGSQDPGRHSKRHQPGHLLEGAHLRQRSTTQHVGRRSSSYVANGLVLRDQYLYSLWQQNPTNSSYSTFAALGPQTSDYVSSNDGATNTLMLGENTQAPPTAAAAAGASQGPQLVRRWQRHCQSVGPDRAKLVASDSGPNRANFWLRNIGIPPYAAGLVTLATPYGTQLAGAPLTYYNGNVMTANINSAHSGGCNVVFFDQHGQFLRDDAGTNLATGSTTVTVYQILVTPEGSKNGTEPAADEGVW